MDAADVLPYSAMLIKIFSENIQMGSLHFPDVSRVKFHSLLVRVIPKKRKTQLKNTLMLSANALKNELRTSSPKLKAN